MSALKNLVGQRFGRLLVLERVGSSKYKEAIWKCRCDCGNEINVVAGELKKGSTRSCGCLKKEVASKLMKKLVQDNVTHGMSGTPVYRTWASMLQRCTNPNSSYYKNYGGRGITVCDSWHDFQNFYDDVSKLPHFYEEGYSLDRIDNNGNYELSNVRFADRTTQNRNRRDNIIVNYNGEEMTLVESATKSGIKLCTLYRRYYCGDRGDRLFR